MSDGPGRDYLLSDLIETLTEEQAALYVEERAFHNAVRRALSGDARDAE